MAFESQDEAFEDPLCVSAGREKYVDPDPLCIGQMLRVYPPLPRFRVESHRHPAVVDLAVQVRTMNYPWKCSAGTSSPGSLVRLP